MFEVLEFVYENYGQGPACPELPRLGRKLSAAGFDPDEIQQALAWLDGLDLAAHATRLAGEAQPPAAAEWPATVQPSAHSLRVYSVAEQARLGAECLGFVCFLESAGVLPPALREIVLERAMAVPGRAMRLDELKLIVLMVYWRFGTEPDALVLDELSDDHRGRLAH